MSETMTRTTDAGRLVLLGRAHGICAALFGPGGVSLLDRETLDALAAVLDQLGDRTAIEAFESLRSQDLSDRAALAEEYTRLFIRPEVAPYETTHVGERGAMGGKMQMLADIAGFYRAFGFAVGIDRPDHLVPELEFVALLYIKKAYARLSQEEEGAEVCAKTRDTFLREHLLTWLPAFHDDIQKAARHPAYASLASLVKAVAAAS